jgi:hypothetical protein
MKFQMWLENTELQSAINSFSERDKCLVADYGRGACDNLSTQFLNHAKQFGLNGILLAVDSPTKIPTLGWEFWGKGAIISHYLAYFPDQQLGVDFAARQFWEDAPVPMVLSLDQIKKLWKELPFGLSDSREFEDYEY